MRFVGLKCSLITVLALSACIQKKSVNNTSNIAATATDSNEELRAAALREKVCNKVYNDILDYGVNPKQDCANVSMIVDKKYFAESHLPGTMTMLDIRVSDSDHKGSCEVRLVRDLAGMTVDIKTGDISKGDVSWRIFAHAELPFIASATCFEQE